MNRRAILLACAVLADPSSFASCNKCFNDRHLDRAVLAEAYMADREQTRMSLLKTNVEGSDSAGAIAKKIRKADGSYATPTIAKIT